VGFFCHSERHGIALRELSSCGRRHVGLQNVNHFFEFRTGHNGFAPGRRGRLGRGGGLCDRSLAADASVAFQVAGGIGARLGGGWQRSAFINSANEFRTNGYTVLASIEHPQYQFSVALNDSLSNSLPLYNDLLGLGPGAASLFGLQVIPSDYRALSFSAHANPLRKLELSATWTRSRQHLGGVLSNDFELLNAYVTYHFRRLQLESGYIRFKQTFALYPSTNRMRFYVRVQRTARIL